MERRRLLEAAAAASLAALPGGHALVAAAAQPAAPVSRKYVFAHYMVAWPRGGPHAQLEDYAAEIRDALARGIDGFALNCGGWHASEPHYKQRALLLYEAAKGFSGRFKLFVSIDGNAQNELDDIVATIRGLDAQLMQDGKPVLSAYGLGGRDPARCNALIRQARQLGAWFIPHFSPGSGEAVIGPEQATEIAKRTESADGYFFFGAAASPDSLASSIRLLAFTLRRARKALMAPVTPYYRGLASGTNYRAFETNGFNGMADEWQAAIAADADWVQIVTWNDWAESTYVAPIGSTSGALVYNERFGILLNHTGYLDASRYFIDWFKSGVKPAIDRDEIFYFYRLHPVDLHTNLIDAISNRAAFPPRGSGRLTSYIHVTAFVPQEASLQVTCGANRWVLPLQAGVNEAAFPWTPGRPRFVLVRNGQTVLQKTGEETITRDDYSGAFNYFSGSMKA
ncbi:glycoside hydrolase family 71 protein [Paraburkholderia sp. 2C]